MGACGGQKESVWVDRGWGQTGTLWGGWWCEQWGQADMASGGHGMRLLCGQIGLGGAQGVGCEWGLGGVRECGLADGGMRGKSGVGGSPLGG